MTNITHFIHRTVEDNAVIRQGLALGLITPRSLASFIVKSNPSENLSLEAVRTAIRRNKKEFLSFSETQNKVNHIFKDTKIHLKSGIVRVAFKKGDASLELINRSFKAMEIYDGDTFRVIKGQKILHILVDEENLDMIQKLFEERILEIDTDICEITASMPEEAKQTAGLYASIINEIALNNINIIEAFSCGTEINVFVAEKDNKKTFDILQNLFDRANIGSKKKK